jgi:hypothetical protein
MFVLLLQPTKIVPASRGEIRIRSTPGHTVHCGELLPRSFSLTPEQPLWKPSRVLGDERRRGAFVLDTERGESRVDERGLLRQRARARRRWRRLRREAGSRFIAGSGHLGGRSGRGNRERSSDADSGAHGARSDLRFFEQ